MYFLPLLVADSPLLECVVGDIVISFTSPPNFSSTSTSYLNIKTHHWQSNTSPVVFIEVNIQKGEERVEI